MQFKILDIHTRSTRETGILSFFESQHDIPFPIRRIYYIHGVARGMRRGFHAHKRLQQFLFCPYGRVEIMLDDGRQRTAILLDKPNKGLLLEDALWREMLWLEDNSVLCVAASDYYDEDDYIRDYQAFLKYIKEQGK